jgi:xanthine dehydrogenase accessory factor
LPRSYLLIAGATPVARALGQIASKLDFTIVQFVKSDELSDVRPLPDVLITDVADIDRYLDNLDRDVRTASAAIAASQAVYDEPALTAFLKHGIGFTALVASPHRGRSVIDALAQWGVPRVDLDRVHYPAGIDIGAQRPGDVAISILAQIIAERRTPAPSAVTIVDPVCGMTVDAVASRDRAEFNGATYYFCGSHCSSAFAAEPEAYIVAVSKSRG